MEGCWRHILIKLSIWLVVEVFLNCLGWDTVADYGEFILQGKLLSGDKTPVVTLQVVPN